MLILRELTDAGGKLLEIVVWEDEDLEGGEVGDVLRDLGQLVRTQVQLHHVHPRPNICTVIKNKKIIYVYKL